jgi:MFS family permease
MGLGELESSGAIGSAWRWMFVIGAIPALLALVIRSRLKEPEKWREAKSRGGVEGKQFGSYAELFGNEKWKTPACVAAILVASVIGVAFFGPGTWPKLIIGVALSLGACVAGLVAMFGGNEKTPWRHNAFIGLLLACSGVIGLWGIGFFSIDLIRSVLKKTFEAQGLSGPLLQGKLTLWAGISSMVLNVGAFFGMVTFSRVTQRIGRRPTFAIFFLAAMLSTAGVFWFLKDFKDIFWMLPIMGFCQLALFGGYAIYFPELFPTHLRSTGTSFCYNVGRFIAASGPAVLGLLTSQVFHEKAEPMRYAGVTMCLIFLLGLIVLPFAPETKGKPLPEDAGSFAH